MKNLAQSKANDIQKLFRGYCKKHLDDDYLRLCNKLFNDLFESDDEIFNRGKENIWAAAIVWAIGSVNFLGDKSFDPSASLSDVCNYFKVKTSTVGQKASRIREWFDMDYFNDYYQREDSQISGLLKSLVMIEDGFIVPRDLPDNESEESFLDDDSEELPGHYIIAIDTKGKFGQADLYQLEYLFKTVLSEDEKIEKIEMSVSKQIHLYFYGRPAKVLAFEKKLNTYKFTISDVSNKL